MSDGTNNETFVFHTEDDERLTDGYQCELSRKKKQGQGRLLHTNYTFLHF